MITSIKQCNIQCCIVYTETRIIRITEALIFSLFVLLRTNFVLKRRIVKESAVNPHRVEKRKNCKDLISLQSVFLRTNLSSKTRIVKKSSVNSNPIIVERTRQDIPKSLVNIDIGRNVRVKNCELLIINILFPSTK